MSNPIYNPETQTVTVKLPWGESCVYTYKEWFARNFVFAHLSYNGGYRNVLTADEQWQAYQLCDGFGEFCISYNVETDEAQWQQTDLNKIGWDWSHVRDSSPEALIRCADWIARKKWVIKSLDKLVKTALAEAEKFDLSPLDVVHK